MTKKSLLILIAEIGVIILVIIGIIQISTGSKKPATQQTAPQTTVATPTTGSLTPINIPFDYRVVSVSASRIVLNGDKGNLTLTNNPKLITVYKGTPTNNTPAAFTDVKEGNKIKIEAIPGVSIKVYILP